MNKMNTKFLLEMGAVLILLIVLFITFVIKPGNKQEPTPEPTPSPLATEMPVSDTEEIPSTPVQTPEPTADIDESFQMILPTPTPLEFGYTYQEVIEWTDEELTPYLSQVAVPDDYKATFRESGNAIDDSDPWFWEKNYLSYHPEIMIPDFGNPYYEDEMYFQRFDDYSYHYGVEYQNSVVQCEYNDSGDYIVVGCNDSLTEDGICLNAYSSASDHGANVGFYYMGTDAFFLDYRLVYTQPARPEIGSGNMMTNYILTDIPYDSAIPSVIEKTPDEGIWWVGTVNDTVYIRIVNLDTSEFLGCVRLNITRNASNAFEINSITNNIINSDGGIRLADDAISRFFEVATETTGKTSLGNINGRSYPKVTEHEEESFASTAQIEILPNAFFTTTLSLDDNTAIDRTRMMTELYAVHFNAGINGTFTVYYRVPNSEDLTNFIPMGYEVPNPVNREVFQQVLA